MENKKIEISTATILKIVGVLIGLYFLWFIRDIVLLLILILIIVAAFSPLVDWFQGVKIPRLLGVIIIYVAFIGILVGVGFLVIPPLVIQIKEISDNLPGFIEKIVPAYQSFSTGHPAYIDFLQNSLTNLSSSIGSISNQFLASAIGFVSGVALIVLTFVLIFYLLLEEHSLQKFFASFIPLDQKQNVAKVLSKIGEKWGSWFRGQMLLAATVGIIVLIGLSIIGIPYALTLAVVAVFAEFIPIIGPILAAIPAIIIGFTISPISALIVLIFYILVQQLENHLLVPNIMKRTVGLSPVIIIVAILIGGKLAGILGILLAVPIIAGIFVLLKEWKNAQNPNKDNS